MLAITLLLECIGPSIRGELRKKKKHTVVRAGGGRSASFVLDAETNPNLNDLGTSGGTLVAEHVEVDEATAGQYEAKLRRLGALLRANMAKTVDTMGASSKINAIFANADADGNGVLSRKEATSLLMELQTAVASSGEVVVEDEAECEALVSHVDIDGNGCISFVEFLVAFGLSDGHDVEDVRISLAQDVRRQRGSVAGGGRNARYHPGCRPQHLLPRCTSARTASRAPLLTSTWRATAGSPWPTLSRPSCW